MTHDSRVSPAPQADTVRDLWEEYQSCFLRLMGNSALASDSSFMAAMQRADDRFQRAYRVWCGE